MNTFNNKKKRVRERWFIASYKREKDKNGYTNWLIRENLKIEKPFQQIRLICSESWGAVRGNEYHENHTEWFCNVSGYGLLRLKDLENGLERNIQFMPSDTTIVRIPSRVIHALKNIGHIPLCFLILVEGHFEFDDKGNIPDKIKYPHRLFKGELDPPKYYDKKGRCRNVKTGDLHI